MVKGDTIRFIPIASTTILVVCVGLLNAGGVVARECTLIPHGCVCDIVGTMGDDVLRGDDEVIGEKICGLGGNDTIYAGPLDSAYGGDGQATIIATGGASDRGRRLGLHGNDGPDRLVGGPGRDYLHGNDGNDVITGGGGDDDIYGDNGADRLYGGAGNDGIGDGKGRDVIAGGPGPDRLRGEEGADRIVGGAGYDRLTGKEGDDVLRGGPGRDRLRGGPGSDVMDGGTGPDLLDSRDGRRDHLDGGSGRDKGRWDAGLDRVRSVERRR